MIGVVVWSNGFRQQAVLWCEDHGALAYLAGMDNLVGTQDWPAVGDMMELETETLGELRCARNVRPLNDQRLSMLPELLRRRCPPAPAATHLSLVASNPPPQDDTPARRRRGGATG